MPSNKPVVELRAAALKTTECHAPLHHFAPGDIIAFNLFAPVQNEVQHFEISILGTPVPSIASSAYASQGQWEIFFEPRRECVTMRTRCLLWLILVQ